MKAISVVVVDDHMLVRQGLRSILESDARFQLVGEAATGLEALNLVRTLQPDVVLLDVKLPGLGGVEVCRLIMDEFPTTAILILTAHLDRSLVDACVRAGARGYLLKDAENLPLAEHLLAVVNGYAALDPRAAGMLADFVRQHEPSPDILSPRELDVLKHMAAGLTNKEIGAALYITENTVKGHVKSLFARLDAHNRLEAVTLARERKLI